MATDVAVLIPWRSGCEHRERALRWTIDKYTHELPDAEIRLGACNPDLPFNRSEAILDAARHTGASVLVIADGDVYSPVTEALEHVREHGWAVPHLLIHRLSEVSTERVHAGEDWWTLPLSRDNAQDRKPYKGNETGTLLVIRRELLFDIPPDVRCVGWGQEDQCWALALRCLHGPPWRGTHDLVHLWHPPQPRISRIIGSIESKALLRRYRTARRDPERMRRIVAETKELTYGSA